MTVVDVAAVERRLRAIIAEGDAIEDAVRRLHLDEAVGLMALSAAVERVTSIAPSDAQRLVIRACDRHE